MKFYIFGHGSIGRRHQKNLIDLGHLEVDSLEQADCGLVCNPTALHVPTALKVLKRELPVFVEKPLSHNLNGVEKLSGKILVGYCLHFDKSLQQFKQKLKGKKIISVKIVCNSWLPDWRPKIDYRQSYSAKKVLGGGVLLDLSHEIDYALWFFGPVKNVSAKLQSASELNIETEAIADLKLEFVSGIFADIHLSYASRETKRFCEVITESQTLRWEYQPNNEMYVAEMNHFINVASGKETPLVTVADGIKVLKVIAAAKNADKNGTIVQL